MPIEYSVVSFSLPEGPGEALNDRAPPEATNTPGEPELSA